MMNTSLSFDRAAGFYDATRSLAAPVAAEGIEAILQIAGRGALMLDVGTGTGRISVPLMKRGANLVGCDLSPRMMAVLRRKIPASRLTEADASLLPFPAKCFDAVTTCHVMHLVGPWREALREYRRVLKPGGCYINARTEQEVEASVGERIEAFWESRVTAYGADSRRPGIQSEKELHAELVALGAALKKVEVVRYSHSQSARDTIERIAHRVDSQTWSIPEHIFSTTVRELRDWAAEEFPDMDAQVDEPAVFVLDIARFDTAR